MPSCPPQFNLFQSCSFSNKLLKNNISFTPDDCKFHTFQLTVNFISLLFISTVSTFLTVKVYSHWSKEKRTFLYSFTSSESCFAWNINTNPITPAHSLSHPWTDLCGSNECFFPIVQTIGNSGIYSKKLNHLKGWTYLDNVVIVVTSTKARIISNFIIILPCSSWN